MIMCILLLLCACKKEERGQYPIDSKAPAKVSSARVAENLPGGAVIVFDIPQEDDALYVVARYTLDDGTPMEIKASVYTGGSLTIEGIGRSRELPVELRAVDRSRNESEPITVSAHPLDSPIHEIAASMEIKDAFGGISLKWENPTQLPVVIDVFSPDTEDNDNMAQVERFYSSAQEGKANVRGQESKETVFAVNLHDRWGNYTDLKTGRYFPLFEERLDKDKFRRWNPPGLPYIGAGEAQWQIERLWNDIIGQAEGLATYTAPYCCFDMGQTAKLSRFKIHNRAETNLCYNLGHPRRFELWGSDHPNVTNDLSLWQFLGYYESVKPSGLPSGQVSSEDIQYSAIDGEEYDFEDSPYVRYIYFRALETWGLANQIQFCELTFWGEVQKEF